MKFCSFNVNGIRSAVNKVDLVEFVKSNDIDVIGFEETKLSSDDPTDFPLSIESYSLYETISKVRKGYSGVAVLSRVEPLSVHYGLLDGKYDEEGRAVTLEFEDCYFVCLYVPNSGEGLKRLDFRMGFQDDLEKYVDFLRGRKPVVMTGDLNVAKENIDIKNPSTNHDNAGFTDQERERMRNLLENHDLVDSFRYLYPEEVKYSWWSYRFNARANNAGWRIDYFLVSSSLKDRIVESSILTDIMGSDHCPVVLELK